MAIERRPGTDLKTDMPTLGWMILATPPGGPEPRAMPTSPQVMDTAPADARHPTLGGVWAKEAEAEAVLDEVPLDVRRYFKVVPVMVTILSREF